MRTSSLCYAFCLQLFLCLSVSYSVAFPSCHPDQSLALLHFKNSFSIKKPLPSSLTSEGCIKEETISYPKTLTWKNGTNCCLWDGVTCNPWGHVIGLNLNCSLLHGKLLPNSSLFHLTYLQRLDLSANDFDGSQISSNFSQFVSLTHLSLLACNFTGEVPSQISHLHKLVSLGIFERFNRLILKGSTWERLTTNITQIKDLHMAGVDMSSIPVSHVLNNLSSSLVSIWLADAKLHGNLDEKLFSFPHLQEICLDYNPNLTGYLPKSNWSNSIRMLFLRNTSFTGELPPSLWNLTQLSYLDLSNNNFSGQISSSLSNLQNLTFLGLSSNNFIGQFPHSISKLKNLQGLSLSNSGFHGTLPSWIFTLPSLNYLLLSSNQFTGCIGEISAYSLQVLDVSNNKLYGPIPRSIFLIQNLTLLNFSHNSLTGNVLWHHLPWKNMYALDLSSNFLQGELNSSICSASTFDILNLSHNNFTGIIPHCIGSSNLYLSVLDLQNNSFAGTLPETFKVGNNLRTLNLNGNFLKGPLPQSLVNCKGLKVLDLGNNDIDDVFPHWLQALDELQVLVLRGNKLHGLIPNLSHGFHMLRVLDLSGNNLKGPLPASLFKSFEVMRKLDGKVGLQYLNYENNNLGRGYYYQDSIEVTWKGLDVHLEKILTVFTSIDLSNNMFEGEIPLVVGDLLALIGLNFSHNRLTGAIPSSLGNLRNLEWLDLSSNHLTSKIPTKLTNLNFLSVLNLSQNQLEGCIPRGKQFETFSSDSFKGNKELCGFQLMIPCMTQEERQELLPSFEVGFEFGWKPVVLGYACGAAFGATLFQVVMFFGKPQCIASLVNNPPKKRKRRV